MLERFNLTQRVLIAIGIVILIFLLLLAITRIIGGTVEAQEKRIEVCVPSNEIRAHVRNMMIDALDSSFKEQIGHLFATWMKDAQGQPDRAIIGANNAIRAYIGAKAATEAWEPPRC